MRVRNCLECGDEFPIVNRSDANRRHCSQKCSKKSSVKKTKKWHDDHPDSMDAYNKARLVKDPGVWTEKHRAERKEILRLLGNKCIVCGADNPNWLHVDFIETTRNKPYRHPRHLAYVKKHINSFRILCANHHYELTLTRLINGTDITQ